LFDADAFGEANFPMDGKEPLDEILDKVKAFNDKAVPFSKLLSEVNAVDHKTYVGLSSFFINSTNKHAKDTLIEERKYHRSLMLKFEKVIVPMRELAQIHLQTVEQFNKDIDDNYYSIEKSTEIVKHDKANAMDGINLQRKILADATKSLNILEDAMVDSEYRIKPYINSGGKDNISKAEYEILLQKRNQLTLGKLHQFDYSFFTANLIDKTALSLGIYMKETTSQYLGKLFKVFEIR